MNTRQVIGSDGSIQRLEAGRKHTMRLAKGQRVNVREVLPDGRSREADDVIATRKGGDLHLKYADGTELTFEHFYEDCRGDACSVILPGKEAAGHALDGDAAVGTALGDGSHLVYAHGDSASLMTLAGDDSALRGALSPLGTGTVSYLPAAEESSGGIGIGALAGLGSGLGLVAAAGGGGGGGSAAAATVANVVLKGSFVAGPVVSGHGLSVTAYKSDGTVLVTGTVNDDGSFTLDVKTGYVGPVLVVVGDRDGGADYWDEATGAPKDLTIDLRAATIVTGAGTYRVNVNVFTEAAVRSLGIGVGSTTLGDHSPAEIAAANKKLTDALGMLDDLVTGPAPIAVVTSTGAENQNANAYGKLLAAASGVDKARSTEATVEALLVAVAAPNPVLETSVLLLQGASNLVDKLPGFLTSAQMSLNDYFFIADTVNKLRGELAGGLEVGDYSTLKQLSDAVKTLEAALGEDSPLAVTLADLQSQITSLVNTDIAALQARIEGLAQVVTYGFAMQGGAIDGVAADLATLQGVVTALQGMVSDNATEAQALASAQTTLQGAIDALADRVTSEAARLDALIVSNESDIANVAAELLALQGAVTLLQGTVSDNATTAAQALAAAQTTLQGAIDTLGQRVTDEVARLEGLIASNDSDISALTSSLQSVQAQLSALSGAVNGGHDLLEEVVARVFGPYARSGGNLTAGADFRVFTHGIDTAVNLGQFGNSPGANEVVINGAGPAASQSLRITGFTLGSEPHVSDVLRFTQLPNAQALVQQISSVSVAGRVGSDLVSVKLTFSNGGVIELIDLVPKSEIDPGLVPLVSSDGSYAVLPQNEIAPIVLGLAGENIVFGGDGFTFVYYQMLSQISSLRATVDTQAATLTSLQTQIADIISSADVTAPTITGIALSATGADAAGHLNAGDVVTATVKFSEAVLVTGAPTLQLQIGDDTVLATYQGGAGTDSLVFSYTILASQTDADGISVPANALTLGDGAAIKDSAGNAAVATSAASTDDAQLIVDNGPLTLSLSAGTLFGSQFTADNVLVGLISDGPYVFLSDLDADGYYHVPAGAQFIDVDDYLYGIVNQNEQYWQDHVVPGGQSAYIDLNGRLAWTYGEGFQIIVSEENLRAWLSSKGGQGEIDAYIVANTVPAEQVGQYDGFGAGETIAQNFLARIAGHDPADVLLTVTSPLTLAQAARLAEAGFDLAHHVHYSLRDYDTTIQSAMLVPSSAATVRGATLITAIGDELGNAMRFTSFDARVHLRIEAGDGNDTIDTGRGNDQIVGGRGADTINLTYKDSSQDTVIYQTLYDGKTVPVTTLTFSSDNQNYREGSVLSVNINGHDVSYTVAAGQTRAQALDAFASAIAETAAVRDVLVHGNQLEIFGQPGVKLRVRTDSLADIANPGQQTSWDVTFSANADDYPGNQSLGGTITFARQVHITIGGVTVNADVVYDKEGAPDPGATVAALKTEIETLMGPGGLLADVLGSVTVLPNADNANVVLHLVGKTVPATDAAAPTFTVSDATVDVAGEQQQTDVVFSQNNADYYAGGTLSVTIAGHTISANMAAGSAADSLAALKAAIDAAGTGEGSLADVLESVSIEATLSGPPIYVTNTGASWLTDGPYTYGGTRTYDTTAIAQDLAQYGSFAVSWGGLQTFEHPVFVEHRAYFAPDKRYTSLSDWAADAQASLRTQGDSSITVSYNADTGTLTFTTNLAMGMLMMPALVFQHADYSLRLTAATESVDPLEAAGAMAYAGEAQRAALALDGSVTYDHLADGTATDRGAAVYFSGGKAFVTIIGAGADHILGNADDAKVVIQADMGADAAATAANIVAAINAATGASGSLHGIVAENGASVGADGHITLTGAERGKEMFRIDDVRLDYAGVNQIATADFDTGAAYYSGGKLHLGVTPTGGQEVVITADMVNGDAAASLAALKAAIEAEMQPATQSTDALPAIVTIGSGHSSADSLDYLGEGGKGYGHYGYVSVHMAWGQGNDTSGTFDFFEYAAGPQSPEQTYPTLGQLLAAIDAEDGVKAYLDANGSIVLETDATGSGVWIRYTDFYATSFYGGITVGGGEDSAAGTDAVPGSAGSLRGIVGDVILGADGHLTLVSADKTHEQFTITHAGIDYAGDTESASISFDSSAASYWSTGAKIGVTLGGHTFEQAMFTTGVDGPPALTAADRTVQALLQQIIDARDHGTGVTPEFQTWLANHIGSMDRYDDTLVFGAKNPDSNDTIDLTGGFMDVAPVTQVTALDFSGVTFETRQTAAGHTPQVEVSIAGHTITADAGATHADTLNNLLAAIQTAMGEGAGGIADVRNAVGSATLANGVITLTANNPGADPMDVSAVQYETVDPNGADNKPQIVDLSFDNAQFDNPGATPAGTVIHVQVDGIAVDYTIPDGLAGNTRSEQIVAGVKAAIEQAVADANGHSSIGTVVQGGWNLDTFMELSGQPANGYNVLRITAGADGANLLGNPDDASIAVTVTKADHTLVALAVSAGEVQAGNVDLTWTDGSGVVVSQTHGRDQGVLNIDPTDTTTFIVNNVEVHGATGLPAMAMGMVPGHSPGEHPQGVVNPGDTQNPNFDGSYYYGDAPQTGAVDLVGAFNGQGVEQTHTNPGDGYQATAGSPALNDAGANAGDSALYGSDSGYYADDGLHTRYLGGGTQDSGPDGDGNYLYIYRGADNLSHVIDMNAQVNVGAASTTDALAADSFWREHAGFAPFVWDGAGTFVVTPGNAGPDQIHNFQVDHDYIALEGNLLASTVVGNVDGFVGATHSEVVSSLTGDVSWSGQGDDYGGPLPTRWSIDLGLASANDSFTIDFATSPLLHIVGTSEANFAGASTRLYADLSADPMHFDNVAAFEAYIQNAFYDAMPQWNQTSALTAAQAITWSFSDGVLSADVSAASLQFDNTGEPRAYLHPYTLPEEAQVGNSFDLDLDEFGLVDSAHSTLDHSQIANAAQVAALLNSLFSFHADGEDGGLNTSIFAVTAHEDPNATAIWAHRQSSAGDSTVEAIELYQLARVDTLGDEFGLHNFQPQPVMPI